jgi:hypothetical protein
MRKTTFDADRLAEAGWGVITPITSDPNEVAKRLDALTPLIKLREYNARDRFKQIEYRPEETATAFLARQGLRQGFSDPDRLPYYLLIVASPEEIPFSFQVGMGESYAVGRLAFDELRELNHYANKVVAYERSDGNDPRTVTFFGAANPDDSASNFIAYKLLRPLFESVRSENTDWRATLVDPTSATKRQLTQILLQERPRLLITTGQAATFPMDHPDQRRFQGGLVCQDWPGPKAWQGVLERNFYFSGDDLPADTDLNGMITFHMSDYSLGTPIRSEAQAMLFDDIPQLTSKPFVASLPQRMLARGALASIGLADKFWNVGIPNLELFTPDTLVIAQAALRYLLQGATLGTGMQPFRQRAIELAAQLNTLRDEAQFGKSVDSQEMVTTWATLSTLNNLMVFGDPAVRLIPRSEPTSYY